MDKNAVDNALKLDESLFKGRQIKVYFAITNISISYLCDRYFQNDRICQPFAADEAAEDVIVGDEVRGSEVRHFEVEPVDALHLEEVEEDFLLEVDTQLDDLFRGVDGVEEELPLILTPTTD